MKVDPSKRLQPWLKFFLRKTDAPDGPVEASDQDIEIFCAALAGLATADLKKRFACETQDVTEALRNVRDIVRAGTVPERLEAEYPWFPGWLNGKPQVVAITKRSKDKIEKKETPATPIDASQQQAILDITEQPYQALAPDDPKFLPDFLHQAKQRFAVAAGPLALRRLGEHVAEGHPLAVKDAMEFLYGSGPRGPLVAIQQNLGGSDPAAARPNGMFHESIILKYEQDHPEESGETTIYDARLDEPEEE